MVGFPAGSVAVLERVVPRLHPIDGILCAVENYFEHHSFGKWFPFVAQLASSGLVGTGGAVLVANSLLQPNRVDMIKQSLLGTKKEGFAPQNKTQERAFWMINGGYTSNIASVSTVGFALGSPVIAFSNLSMGALSPMMQKEIPFSLWAAFLGLVLPCWAYVGGRKTVPMSVDLLSKTEFPSFVGRLGRMLGQNFREGWQTILNPTRLLKLGSQYHGFYVATGALICLVPGGLGVAISRTLQNVFYPKPAGYDETTQGIWKTTPWLDNFYWASKQVFKAGSFFDATAMFFMGRNLKHPLKMIGGALILLGSPILDSPLGRGFHAFGTGSVFLSFAISAFPKRL